MSKWHKREIVKGVLGELSKIREELEEAEDAEEQKQILMKAWIKKLVSRKQCVKKCCQIK